MYFLVSICVLFLQGWLRLVMSSMNLLLFMCVSVLLWWVIWCSCCVIFCSIWLLVLWLRVLLMGLKLFRLRNSSVILLCLWQVWVRVVFMCLVSIMWLGRLVSILWCVWCCSLVWCSFRCDSKLLKVMVRWLILLCCFIGSGDKGSLLCVMWFVSVVVWCRGWKNYKQVSVISRIIIVFWISLLCLIRVCVCLIVGKVLVSGSVMVISQLVLGIDVKVLILLMLLVVRLMLLLWKFCCRVWFISLFLLIGGNWLQIRVLLLEVMIKCWFGEISRKLLVGFSWVCCR